MPRRKGAEPRWMTPRTKGRPTLGRRVAGEARRLGWEPMPWQRHWWDVSLELIDGDHGPVLAYQTALAVVPRQAGKSTEQQAVIADRGRNFREPQITALLAQTGKDALEAMRTKWWPRFEQAYGDAKEGGEVHFRKAHGSEAFEWANGSRHMVLPPKRDAGHGLTLDAVLIDEAWAYRDNRVEAAVVPAMLTRPWKQIRISSTRGDETSTYLDAKIDLGREAADLQAEGHALEGLCYLEYSAPEEADADDPATWWATHPAMGHTIGEADMRMLRDSLASEPGEFDRAGLNRPRPRAQAPLALDLDAWARACDASRIVGPEAWAISTGVQHTSCAVARAGVRADGHYQMLVMEYRDGTAWVASKLAEVVPRGTIGVDRLLDGSLIPELERVGLKVQTLGTADAINAFATVRNQLREGTLHHAGQATLSDAVRGATTRIVRGSNAELFKRAGETDISPLVAASLALWMLVSGLGRPRLRAVM